MNDLSEQATNERYYYLWREQHPQIGDIFLGSYTRHRIMLLSQAAGWDGSIGSVAIKEQIWTFLEINPGDDRTLNRHTTGKNTVSLSKLTRYYDLEMTCDDQSVQDLLDNP